MFTYQIQHRFDNVPVAHLSNLDQSDENSKFHFDIPDRNRWIDYPSREHHWTWAGRHHCLTGGSGDRRRVLPVTWRRLSVRERHRARHCHRCLACHLHASVFHRLVISSPPVMNWTTALGHQKKRKENTRLASENKTKTTKNNASLCKIYSWEFHFGVCWAVAAKRLKELTDLCYVHECVCMCRSGCAPLCSCHRHVAAPCLRFHSPRLRWPRWWSWGAGDWPLARPL